MSSAARYSIYILCCTWLLARYARPAAGIADGRWLAFILLQRYADLSFLILSIYALVLTGDSIGKPRKWRMRK